MIVIVNYGLGNIRAFVNVYNQLAIPFTVATKSDDLRIASKIILPGVGTFDNAMERLERSGMREMLGELVLKRNVPVLGICIGMQILACLSEEGRLPGLGWIDGEVKKIDTSTLSQSTRLPHMGWNDVQPTRESRLFKHLEQPPRFYFLHSYFLQCRKCKDVLAVTDYGGQFTCAVNSGNIFGVQFHPEKSHKFGIQLLKNFGDM
jgi:imidazole glycerol-phosphate synthase subunit HisH